MSYYPTTPTIDMEPETEIEVDGAYTTWGQYQAKKEDKEAEDWADKVVEEYLYPGALISDFYKNILKEIHKEIRRQVKNYRNY